MKETNDSTAGVRYAGFWIRVWATLIDSVLLLFVTFPPLLFLPWLQEGYPWMARILSFFFNWVLPFIIIMLFWKYKGATPGKMLFSIRIVDARDLSHPSLWRFVGRYFGYFLSLIPLGLGYLWVGWSPKKQGFHDLAEQTAVIEDNAPKNAGQMRSKLLKVFIARVLIRPFKIWRSARRFTVRSETMSFSLSA